MFQNSLELAVARARRRGEAVAVLYLDLDNIKLVNDSLGHTVGDELLREIAIRLRSAVREADLVARQGGDEFLVLLPDLDRRIAPTGRPEEEMAAELVAGRIKQALAQPFRLADTDLYVSASMGISLFPSDTDDPRELLRHADSAMYRSKSQGPGGWRFAATTPSDSLSRLSLVTRLRRAADEHEWALHYQPIVDLASGRLVGVEALVRWRQPTGRLVQPQEFITLAEETGLIDRIGEWVLGEIAIQAATWVAEGIDLDVGFNVSVRELQDPDLPARIDAHIRRAGVSPGKIVVEITETAAMIDPGRTQEILWALHRRGYRLAVDDFGTGYSSLSRLRTLPVDILKIDRPFVRDVPEDPAAGEMVKAVVALARGVGMQPLAEGVETEAQREFLLATGCRLGQGFLFSRPVLASQITLLYRAAQDLSLLEAATRRLRA